ncbi:MAG: hypothetical protein IH951_16000 [Bacteroidetes bacterium]|nr:hypothetical protein [Bacteroidota bacterium]
MATDTSADTYSVVEDSQLVVADRIGDGVQLIGRGEEWSYDDTGVDLGGTGWNAKGAADLGKTGFARLGYGDDGEVTLLDFGGDANNKIPTYYFVKSFNIVGAIPDSLTVNMLVGMSMARYNIPL